MKYTHILWDWNGTLLDDVAISIDCVNVLMKKLGAKPTDLKEYHKMMDIPIIKYYENLFNSRNLKFDYKFCTENFQKSYPKMMKNASLMDGATEILEFFKEKNAKQYIVSSFEKNRLASYVSGFGISHYFEKISGDDDIHVGSKSQRAIDIVKGIQPEKVLYIGDTKADYITAKDVGCDCILISKGHQQRSVLEEFGCKVIDNLSEIKNYI